MSSFFRMFLLLSSVSILPSVAMENELKVSGHQGEILSEIEEPLAQIRNAVGDDDTDTEVDLATAFEDNELEAHCGPYKVSPNNKATETTNLENFVDPTVSLRERLDTMPPVGGESASSVEGASDWSESEEQESEKTSFIVSQMTSEEVIVVADNFPPDAPEVILNQLRRDQSSNVNQVTERANSKVDNEVTDSSVIIKASSVPEKDDTTGEESSQGVASQLPDDSEAGEFVTQLSEAQDTDQSSNTISLPLKSEEKKVLDGPPVPPKNDGKVHSTKLILLSTILGIMTYVIVYHYSHAEALDEANALLPTVANSAM